MSAGCRRGAVLAALAVLAHAGESWDNPPKALPEGVEHRTFPSARLGCAVGYNLVLPPGHDQAGRRFPVVYALPGRTDSESTHLGNCVNAVRLMRIGAIPPLIYVAAFAGRTSWVADAPDGSLPAESLVLDELIPHIEATCAALGTRAGRAIEGWSMGGHGALKLALKHPDRFVSVVAYSGPLTVEQMARLNAGDLQRMYGGDPAAFARDSPAALARANAARIRGRLAIRLVIGAKDGLRPGSEHVHAVLDELGIAHAWQVVPDVGHSPAAIYAKAGPDGFTAHAAAFAAAAADR